MPRAQCVVCRKNKLLMVKHQHEDATWWCLPGGGVEVNETPAEAAVRELWEECRVDGVVIRELATQVYSPRDRSYTFLLEIGDQDPQLGIDPEFTGDAQILVDVRWLALSEIPERDRAFLWASGLLGLEDFLSEVESWGNEISYPKVGEGYGNQSY